MARKTTKNNKKVEKETNTNNFIQTVILADSESENFFPLTKTIPKLLLPIANVPAIDYILEMLQKVDTEEILIISSSEHCEKIQRYLDSSKYSRNKIFIFKLIPVISQNGNCDALRRIEQMDIIRSEPFILISSIPVTNFDLKPVIEIHRRNFKENRHNFITCVMKEYPKNHRNLSVTDNNFIVVTTPTKTSSIERILNFSQNWDNFDISKFVQNGQLNIRQGFVDIGIDICSLSVLRLCFDNFDYRLLRLHLLKNAIESEIEEMIAHIYVPDEKDYFGVVKEMKSFDSVTKDIIGNWAYPLGPQNNFYEFGLEIMEQSFIHPSAQISSTAKIKSGCIIAQNCKIGANSILEKTVLGPFSQIGENNKIENSYFLSGATIQDNCSVLYSFSGNNVTIGKNCFLNHATVVADNVKIDENTTTKQFSVIQENRFLTTKKMVLNGRRISLTTLKKRSFSSMKIIEEFVESESSTLSDSGKSKEREKGEQTNLKFSQEIIEIIKNAEINNNSVEMTCIEITSLKLSMGLTDNQNYFVGIFEALLNSVSPLPKSKQIENLQKSTLNSVEKIFKKWKKLILSFCETENDQFLVLKSLEQVCANDNYHFISFFTHCVRILYDTEILFEEVILNWWKEINERKTKGVLESRNNDLLNAIRIFIEWLSSEEYEESSE